MSDASGLSRRLPAVPLEPLSPDDPDRLGDYRLLGRLGTGGMGIAYLAAAPDASWVVVKTTWRHLASDPSFRARLSRELDAMSRAASASGAATLLGSDVRADPPWFAMEFIPGTTLARLVQDTGPLSAPDVSALAEQLARILAAVHTQGITHRDFKPANIMMSPTGPRLIDFGIAEVSEGTQLTRTGSVVGSTGWLAPEQVRGDVTSSATDVHAWSLTVLYAATGRPPFGADNTAAAIYKVLEFTPEVPVTIPEPLNELILSALAKDPERRPTLDRIVAELERGARPISSPQSLIAPPPPSTLPAPAVQPDPIAPKPVEHPPSAPSAQRSPLVIVAFALSLFGFMCGIPAIAALILGIIGLRRSPPQRPGRGLALAAIAISSLWLAFVVGLLLSALSNTSGLFFLVPALMAVAIGVVGIRMAQAAKRRLWIPIVILAVAALWVLLGILSFNVPTTRNSATSEGSLETTTASPNASSTPSTSRFTMPPSLAPTPPPSTDTAPSAMPPVMDTSDPLNGTNVAVSLPGVLPEFPGAISGYELKTPATQSQVRLFQGDSLVPLPPLDQGLAISCGDKPIWIVRWRSANPDVTVTADFLDTALPGVNPLGRAETGSAGYMVGSTCFSPGLRFKRTLNGNQANLVDVDYEYEIWRRSTNLSSADAQETPTSPITTAPAALSAQIATEAFGAAVGRPVLGACYTAYQSLADPTFAALENSKFAMTHSSGACAAEMSDAWNVVQQTSAGWRFTGYSGGVDTCDGLRSGMLEAGVSSAAADDLVASRRWC